jgi:DNA ligase 1
MLPMLATDAPKDLRELEYPLWASIKHDGVRAVVRGGVVLAARSGKPIPNQYIQKAYGVAALEGMEGELVAQDVLCPPFSHTQSVVMSSDRLPLDLVFWVFDYVGTPDLPFNRRNDAIQRVCVVELGHRDCYAAAVRQIVCQTPEELRSYYTDAVGNGEEGIMIRWPQSPYIPGRVRLKQKAILKLKPEFTGEGILEEIHPEMENTNEKTTNPNGKNKRSGHKDGMIAKETAGKLVLNGLGMFQDRTINLGSGLTESQSKEIWDYPQRYTGKAITFSYKGLTSSGLPRFPVFKHFRDAEDME